MTASPDDPWLHDDAPLTPGRGRPDTPGPAVEPEEAAWPWETPAAAVLVSSPASPMSVWPDLASSSAPPPVSASASASAAAPAAPAGASAADARGADASFDDDDAFLAEAALAFAERDAQGAHPPTSATEHGSTPLGPDLRATAVDDAPPRGFAGLQPADDSDLLPLADPRADPADQPSFVRRADRAARWQRPGVRRALGAAAAVAALLLAGQVLFEVREPLAARWPAAREPLVAACQVLGCRVGPPRSIHDLAVESSGLVRVGTSDLYRFALTVRNRAGFGVAVPAVDLVLNDAATRLVARRVLRVTELDAAAPPSIAGGRELVLNATLRVSGGEPVAGYTIEVFYP